MLPAGALGMRPRLLARLPSASSSAIRCRRASVSGTGQTPDYSTAAGGQQAADISLAASSVVWAGYNEGSIVLQLRFECVVCWAVVWCE